MTIKPMTKWTCVGKSNKPFYKYTATITFEFYGDSDAQESIPSFLEQELEGWGYFDLATTCAKIKREEIDLLVSTKEEK